MQTTISQHLTAPALMNRLLSEVITGSIIVAVIAVSSIAQARQTRRRSLRQRGEGNTRLRVELANSRTQKAAARAGLRLAGLALTCAAEPDR